MTVLRIYDPEVDDFRDDGYPVAWAVGDPAIKDLVRAEAGNRCVRCHHPYAKGAGEWSPCDERCTHGTPIRWSHQDVPDTYAHVELGAIPDIPGGVVEAQWRILTVHHLNGVRGDCRWWNLAALCQRCHLTIQGRVVMERVYVFEHSDWFKPYAAGWYASAYLGQELDRDEVDERLDELLSLERVA